MKTAIITYTHNGMKVASKALQAMATDTDTVTIYCHDRCQKEYAGKTVPFTSIGRIMKDIFTSYDRILFICAAAIAVRSVAPYLKSKVTDPAVLVADEDGRYIISLLSGHIGGANEWCNELATAIRAIPVITTATDNRGMFAVDIFAKDNNMRIVNPDMIKEISGRVLNNEPVGITGDGTYRKLLTDTVNKWKGQIELVEKSSDYVMESGIQIIIYPDEESVFRHTLKLVPMDLAVGIGCKRGKSYESILKAVKDTFESNNLLIQRIAVAASIDRKSDEQGIIEFARHMRIPYKTYSPECLMGAEGEYTMSDFVRKQVGVDNVCERSAYVASGGGDRLVAKTICDGVTVAVYKCI